jgi:AraC-like DNA-binding protein
MYQKAIQQYAIVCICLISAALLLPLVCLWPYMDNTMKLIVSIILILHIGWVPIIHTIPIDSILRTFVWYIFFSSLLMLPLAFMVAGINGPTAIIYFLVIPLTGYVVFPFRQVVGWSIFAFLLILAAYLPHCIFEYPLSDYLGYNKFPHSNQNLSTLSVQELEDISQQIRLYNKKNFTINNMCNFLIVFFHICFSIYYKQKIHTISEIDKSKTDKSKPSANSDDKQEALYQRIVEYMESEEPFRNPSFTVSHIATAMDVNHNYIATVFRTKGINITNFVNSYRVEFVKKALQQTDAKYTIEHLSTSAGFNNQATFNRLFKAGEGYTPREYMNLFQEAKKDE